MIRTFRLYTLGTLGKMPSEELGELPKTKLSDLALTAPKPLSRKISDLANLLKDERLQIVHTGPPRWELQLTGRWPARSISVATESPPFVPVRVMLWIRWLVPWLIIFEANRVLAEAASRLVAATFVGDVSKAKPFKPDLRHWQVLRDWVSNDSNQIGALLGGRFYKATVGGIPVESIDLRCVPGADKSLILDCFDTAAGIGELLVQSPQLETVNQSVMFRVSRLGNICVYGETISDQLIDDLLSQLESLWGFLPEK